MSQGITLRNTRFHPLWADGSEAKEATLVGGSATISDATLIADDGLLMWHVSAVSGTRGALYIASLVAGTSVRVRSTSTTDTSRIRLIRIRIANDRTV